MELLDALKIGATTDKGVALHAFLDRNRTLHPWNGGSAAEWTLVWWAWQAYLDGEAYTAAPHDWERANPRPTSVLDWRAIAIEEVCAHVEEQLLELLDGADSAGQHPERIRIKREGAVEPWIPYLPAIWDGERLGWVGGQPPDLELAQDLRALLQLPELRHLRRHFRAQVVFRTKEKVAHGRRILGSIKKLGGSDRALWPTQPAPYFRLELDFSWWLAMGTWRNARGSRELRARLLHHELMHAICSEDGDGKMDVRLVGHGWEDHGATVERYGPLTMGHARAIRAGARHPKTTALLEAAEPHEGSFLLDTDAEAVALARPTAGFWITELADLRLELEQAEKAWAESPVDLGAAPWEELRAMLATLAEVTSPGRDHLSQAELVQALIRRWAPGRGA